MDRRLLAIMYPLSDSNVREEVQEYGHNNWFIEERKRMIKEAPVGDIREL